MAESRRREHGSCAVLAHIRFAELQGCSTPRLTWLRRDEPSDRASWAVVVVGLDQI